MGGWFRPLKYLDPKNRLGFYKLFGVQKNKYLLMHFLNAFFFSKAPLRKIEILSPAYTPFKTSMVDALCVDKNGTKYIIQLEPVKELNHPFEIFAEEYAFKTYSDQANLDCSTVKEIIYIAIADYQIFPSSPCYKWKGIKPKKSKCNLKNFSFNFIELPKFQKNKEELFSMEDKWCYFFKHAYEATKKDLEKLTGKDRVFHRAYTALDQSRWTDNELVSYDAHTRIDMDNKAVLDYKIDEGQIELAKRLLRQGIEIDLIAQCSDLSKQMEDLKECILNENSA